MLRPLAPLRCECGTDLFRTGKKGRPPRYCEACKARRDGLDKSLALAEALAFTGLPEDRFFYLVRLGRIAREPGSSPCRFWESSILATARLYHLPKLRHLIRTDLPEGVDFIPKPKKKTKRENKS